MTTPRRERAVLPRAAVVRLTCAAVLGGAIGVAVAVFTAAAATLFVVSWWAALWPMDAAATRNTVQREDFRPVAHEVVIVATALAGLVGIVALLLSSSGSGHAAAAIAPGGVFIGVGGSAPDVCPPLRAPLLRARGGIAEDGVSSPPSSGSPLRAQIAAARWRTSQPG